MVTTQQYNLSGILELQCHQDADDFKRVLALINIIPEEHVIICVYIAHLVRCLPEVKEAHQVNVLTVNVAEDLGWWPDACDHSGLSGEHLSAFGGEFDDLLARERELCVRLDVLTLLGLKQRLQESLA